MPKSNQDTAEFHLWAKINCRMKTNLIKFIKTKILCSINSRSILFKENLKLILKIWNIFTHPTAWMKMFNSITKRSMIATLTIKCIWMISIISQFQRATRRGRFIIIWLEIILSISTIILRAGEQEAPQADPTTATKKLQLTISKRVNRINLSPLSLGKMRRTANKNKWKPACPVKTWILSKTKT